MLRITRALHCRTTHGYLSGVCICTDIHTVKDDITLCNYEDSITSQVNGIIGKINTVTCQPYNVFNVFV